MAYKRASEEIFMEGTVHLVANGGIENLRTKDVADYAGFSEATLFRFFETKETLLKRTFLWANQGLADYIRSGADKPVTDLNSFLEMIRGIWRKMYRYLINHGDITIFLIRYRYSASYTDEVRIERLSENTMKQAGELFGQYVENTELDKDFLIRYIYEVTLCFAEKVVTGKVADLPEVEDVVWLTIVTTVEGMMKKEFMG